MTWSLNGKKLTIDGVEYTLLNELTVSDITQIVSFRDSVELSNGKFLRL